VTQITQIAVQVAFDALLTTFTDGGDVNLAGTPYIPQAGVPYLASQIAAFQRMPEGVGPNAPNSVAGSYAIRVNRPAIEGLAMAGSLAGRLVALFHRGLPVVLATGPILTIEAATEQPAIMAGDWLTVPVNVSWYGSE
jgi:hypothetical protein